MSDEHRTSVGLTDEQLVYLSGFPRELGEDAAAAVDAAHLRLSFAERYPEEDRQRAKFLADVVFEARASGKLLFQRTRMRGVCRVCGKRPEPTRYRSGRRKGQVKALGEMSGAEFADRFVRVQGRVSLGCCASCATSLLPLLQVELANVRAEVPEKLAAEGRPAWKHFKRTRCTNCGWEGHRGQLGMLPALMSGTYPGKCPSCGAEHRPLGRNPFEQVDGFEVVT